MPIRTEDVKIKASQRLTDNTDGGGFMTATEIVDGAINNMFRDISRLDRTYGRVSLRKGYVHVDTDDTEMYSGAHMIISELAKDPNVNVAIFRTENDADTRLNAVNRLESYVTLGPRSQFWLWSDHPAGSRNLLLFGLTGAEPPETGDVLCLFNNKGGASEYRQYVRVMKVERENRSFAGGNRQILEIEIGDPLEVTFVGVEIHHSDSTPTTVYTTNVSDAAKYYGVMKPAAAIRAGDVNIKVESIYTQLVPTSQAESPLINLTPGESGPIKKCGDTLTISFPSDSWTTLNLGQALVPGTLSLKIGNTQLTDAADGTLMRGSNQAGVVDYATGLVTLASALSGAVTASFDPGAAMANIPTTLRVDVFAASRGYNYVAIMWPPPLPGTITADYMAEGKWYRLRDNGAGLLVPDVEGTGTGRVDYQTGQMQITCAALPDVDTPILVCWGNPTEIIRMQGAVEIDVEPIQHVLSGVPVAPGSLEISWPVGVSQTETATDDGNGNIVEGSTIIGWINYGTGEMEFWPEKVPVSGGECEYTVNHEKYAPQVATMSGTTFTLPNAPIKPGSLAMSTTVTVEGWNHTWKLLDDGDGKLYALAWKATLSQSRAATSSSSQYSSSGSSTSSDGSQYAFAGGSTSSDPSQSGSGGDYQSDSVETNTTIAVNGWTATVDYVTGQVVCDLSTATGTKKTTSAKTVANKASNQDVYDDGQKAIDMRFAAGGNATNNRRASYKLHTGIGMS